MADITKERIQKLEKEIKYHQDLYYNKQPEISDEDFDVLWDELKELDPQNALFKTVGVDTGEGFAKAEHIIPMGSQEKAANPEQFLQWAAKMPFHRFIVQYKLDGASLELQYRRGELVKAVTRGNGTIGDDITANVKKMEGVLLRLRDENGAVNFSGGIRGEVIMKRSVHKAFYADKANCRNATNGVMKRKDGTGSEHLTVICYDALSEADARSGILSNEFFSDELEKIAWLKRLGFTVVEQKICESADEVIAYRAAVMQLRDGLDFDIDGLVVKNWDIDIADISRPRPEKQIAFKFSLQEAVSTVREVEWSESGATYTPIAIIDPVRLAGTTVKRASLANPNVITSLDLKIGSKVIVTKRGEIIPKIESLVSNPPDAYDIPFPYICSACHTELVNEGSRLYCPNPDCKKLIHHRLEKWIAVLDIQEFGKTILARLFEMGMLHSVSDIYRLRADQLAVLERMGEISAQKLIASINAKREITLEQFIAGFDIDGIGEVMAGKLVEAGYDSLEKILAATEEQLAQVPNFGEIMAHNLVQGMQAAGAEMQELIKSGTITIKPRENNLPLSGKSFCFTGELATMKRSQAESLVKQKGGAVKSSVVKDLTFLVTNEPDSGSAKNLKAQKLGVSIIDEKTFLQMV